MVRNSYVPDTGHLIKIDLDPRTGHEHAGWRPAIVLSPASYNRPTGLAIVAPITSQQKGYPFEVVLPVGLKVSGVVLSDAIKNVDWRARDTRFVDVAPTSVVEDIREQLGLLLSIGQT